MQWIKGILCLSIALLPAWSANALCTYKGKMYAETTFSQEFSDATWVVKARVIAADNHWSGEDESWTLYHLQVITAFKGKPQSRIEMFTYRDSGGFYLDKGMNPDLGGEYLLFLDPISKPENVPVTVRNATEVNYACGQSKAWDEVSGDDQKRLAELSPGR